MTVPGVAKRMMRVASGAVLFARARHAGWSLLGILVVCVAAAPITAWFVASERFLASTATAPVSILAPTLIAVIIGVVAAEPLRDEERLSAQPLQHLVVATVCGMVAVAALVLGTVVRWGGGEYGSATAIRNVVGLTGIGLLGVRVTEILGVDRRAGIGLPVACVVISWVFAMDAQGMIRPWAWMMWPSSAQFASVIAIVFFLAGWLAYVNTR